MNKYNTSNPVPAALWSAALVPLLGLAGLNAAAPEPTRTFQSEGNPILADGTYFSADAAPLSHDGKLYIYLGNDEAPEENGWFMLKDFGIFVTEDPSSGEWELYDDNLDPDKVFDWATGNNAFASHAVQGPDGRFYWYTPVEAEIDAPNRMSIGVAVSDSPLGPWEDPIGEPLVTWIDVFGDETVGQEVIDPHLFIDDDGTPYLYWGSWGAARVVELDDSLTVKAGEIQDMSGLDWFYEAPWVFKRNDLYYLVYDWKWGGSEYTPSNYQAAIAYATSTSPTGPWEFQDIILSGTSSTTVHPSVIEHDGRWWVTYHTKDAKTGGHFRRSVAIDEVHWDGDKMLPVEQTWANPPAMELTNNLAREAEVSASHTEQPPMTLQALNDGQPPVVRLPPDNWGNYRSNESSVESDWAQYTWDVPVRITGVGIRFHQDPNWIRPPAEWKLEYRNASDQWVEVKGASYPTEVDKWLTIDFEPVTTTALRATFKGQKNGEFYHSVAVSEWEVYSAQAAKLPSGKIQTKVGVAPELPETVRLKFEKAGTLPVPMIWPRIDPELYSKPGTFTVEGRAAGQEAGYVTLKVVVRR